MGLPFHMLAEIGAVAGAGAVGCVCRYAIGGMAWAEPARLYVTAGINLAGCLLIGLVWAILDAAGAPRMWSLLAVTGFLGGFTTFSSFALEICRMLRDGMAVQGAAYLAVSVAGGLLVCAAGMWLGRYVSRHILNCLC